MRVKEKLLLLHNVLFLKMDSREELYDKAGELRRYVVRSDFYPTGPFVYIKEADGGIQIGVPINERAEVKEDQPFTFEEEIYFPKCAYVRCGEDEIEEGYQLLEDYLEENGAMKAEEIFHVVLNVYGDTFTDLYAVME